MTLEDALNLARNLKYGPLPRPDDPCPDVNEAIELIHQERRGCGFNWLMPGQRTAYILLRQTCL